jgi:hypothetical protein
MSIHYEIHAKAHGSKWQLSSNCVDGISRLKEAGCGEQLSAVGLDPATEMGATQVLNRQMLLEAANQLVEKAKAIPNGFQVRFRGPEDPEQDQTGRGISGLLVGGIQYVVLCYYGSWKMHPMPIFEIPADKLVPEGLRGESRFEPADIHTENYGLVKVEAMKGRSEIAVLLSRLRKFALSVSDASLTVTVG